MSKRTRIAAAAVILAGLVGAVTISAQRGGYRYQAPAQSYSGNVRYDGRFVFIRMSYPWGYGRGAPWAHDYPRGEEHFLKILSELTSVSAHTDESSIFGWSDPELYKFPVAYMAEPGYWSMSDSDVAALRAYLTKGGFLILDDFRDSRRGSEWSNVELQVSRAFPEGRWVDLDATHPIFHSFFEIDSLDIIPQAYDQGRPIFRGLFEDNDPHKRLMIVAAFNTDISEFWEWSDTGYAPIEANNEAYKLGVNLFIYGMTH
jgi:hypothetical protein